MFYPFPFRVPNCALIDRRAAIVESICVVLIRIARILLYSSAVTS